MATLTFLILTIFVANSHQHSYNLGGCSNVTPMPHFSMEKFLGIWYVMKKTNTYGSCIVYNFTSTAKFNQYQLEQVSNTYVPVTYNYIGKLTVPDLSVPSQMKVQFPMNVGSSSYTVFMTDYDNYAAIFTCQELPVGKRQSISVLSRRKMLNKSFMTKVDHKMLSFGINPLDLSIVSQRGCREEEDYNISIDEGTFVVGPVFGLIRNIGDGFNFVAGGAKNVVSKVTGHYVKPLVPQGQVPTCHKKSPMTPGQVSTQPEVETIATQPKKPPVTQGQVTTQPEVETITTQPEKPPVTQGEVTTQPEVKTITTQPKKPPVTQGQVTTQPEVETITTQPEKPPVSQGQVLAEPDVETVTMPPKKPPVTQDQGTTQPEVETITTQPKKPPVTQDTVTAQPEVETITTQHKKPSATQSQVTTQPDVETITTQPKKPPVTQGQVTTQPDTETVSNRIELLDY